MPKFSHYKQKFDPNQQHRSAIGNQNNKETDSRIGEINSYLQKEHLRIYNTPMPYTYKGGALPEEFVKAILYSPKSQEEMKLMEALLLVMQIGQNITDTSQRISSKPAISNNYKRNGNYGFGRGSNYTNSTNFNSANSNSNSNSTNSTNANFKPNFNATTSIGDGLLNATHVNGAANLNNNWVSSAQEARMQNKLGRVKRDVQTNDFVLEEEAEIKNEDTSTEEEQNREPRANAIPRKAKVTRSDNVASKKFLALVEEGASDLSAPDKRVLLDLFKSGNKVVNRNYKMILALSKEGIDNPKAAYSYERFFQFTNSRLDAFGNFAIDHNTISAKYQGRSTPHLQQTFWHEGFHYTMTRTAENDDEVHERVGRLEIAKALGATSLLMRSDVGDASEGDKLDNICKEYNNAVKNGYSFFKQAKAKDPVVLDKETETFIDALILTDRYKKDDIKKEVNIVISKNSSKLEKLYFAYYIFERDVEMFKHYRTPDNLIMNGECLANLLDDSFDNDEQNIYLINYIMKKFNPEFYNTNPKVGEYLVGEKNKYERRLMELAIEKTNAYDELFTLEEKFYTSLTIGNHGMSDKAKKDFVKKIIDASDYQEREKMNYLISKNGKDGKLITRSNVDRIVAILEKTNRPYGTFVYDHESESIHFEDARIESYRAKEFFNSVDQVIHHKVAKLYSEKDEAVINEEKPTTYMRDYLEIISAVIPSLRADINAVETDADYRMYIQSTADFSDAYPTTLLRRLELELEKKDDLTKSNDLLASDPLIINNIVNLAKYADANLEKGDSINVAPAKLLFSTRAKLIKGALESEAEKDFETFKSDEFEIRERVFKMFDSSKYKRREVVKIMNALGKDNLEKLSNTPDVVFQSVDDKYAGITFSDFTSISRHDLRDVEQSRNIKAILYPAFGKEFTQEAIDNIIKYLESEPNIDGLLEAVVAHGAENPGQPFFNNPDLIFIYNGKAMFNLPNLKGELSDYLKACQSAYRFTNDAGYFASQGAAELCTDGERNYRFKTAVNNVISPDSPLAEANPSNTDKPSEVNKKDLINCADLVSRRTVISNGDPKAEFSSLQTCSPNKPQSSFLSQGFTALVYEDNALLRSKQYDCNLKKETGLMECEERVLAV